MSGKTKFPREAALAVARELTVALTPLCERMIFAGSLRRLKPEVGDIEVVFIPKIEAHPDPDDLLGHLIPTSLVDAWLAGEIKAGRMERRRNVNGSPLWGPVNKLARHMASGIGVDFFQADRRNWYSLLVCRTGSAESNTRICNAAIERGLRWDMYAGLRDRLSGVLVFEPASERALFERVGLPYLEPKDRV